MTLTVQSNGGRQASKLEKIGTKSHCDDGMGDGFEADSNLTCYFMLLQCEFPDLVSRSKTELIVSGFTVVFIVCFYLRMELRVIRL